MGFQEDRELMVASSRVLRLRCLTDLDSKMEAGTKSSVIKTNILNVVFQYIIFKLRQDQCD